MSQKNGKDHFFFELLCIDAADIKSELALAQALCFSHTLWNGNVPVIENEKGRIRIKDDKSGINVIIKAVDTSNVLTSYFESAFIINLFNNDFESVESMRIKLLKHLKNTLNFNHIRLLTDDVSTYIANMLYPEINKIENLLRKYLIKFFIQRVGFDWWESTANKTMIEKVKMRRSDVRDEISILIDDEVRYVDFDDLGELIYKQSSGYNNPDKIVNRLLNINTNDDFLILKSELQSNYTKYFKDNFQDRQFEHKWKDIIKLRHKVAHHGIFYKNELNFGLDTLASLTEIISNAEKLIDDVVFSIEDKEALRNAKIEASMNETSKLTSLKIIGRLDIPETQDKIYNNYLDIEEEEMMQELEKLQNSKWQRFVGLKWFITEHLANMGFGISSSYLLVNIMIDKGLIDRYEVRTPNGYTIIAIKLSQN